MYRISLRTMSAATVLLAFTLAPLAAGREHFWKTDPTRLGAENRGIVMGPGSAFIEVAIDDLAGRFTMGVPNGGPILLFGHPEPRTSYTTFRIDGTDYSNYLDTESTFGERLQTPTNIGPTNEGSWRIGETGLIVEQRITLVTGTSTGRQDTYLIAYEVINQGAVTRNVGCRVMFDTDLDGIDEAPFQVPGTGPVLSEMEFTGSGIPSYFFVVNDLNDPQVTCQGTLRGGQIHPAPDKFQIADWEFLQDIRFDYTVHPGYVFDDSAYAVYWLDKGLDPGQSITFSTYYGLSSIGVDPTPPLVTALTAPQFLECVDGTLTPNPFQVTLLLSNTLPDATGPVTGIQAALSLPAGLIAEGSLVKSVPDLPLGASDLVSWSVTASGSDTGDLHYSIALSSTNAGSKTIPGILQVPAGCSQSNGGLRGSISVGNSGYSGPVNGPDVLSWTLNLRDPDGSLTPISLQGPTFALQDLEPGTYQISAAIQYGDHIPFSALLGPYGCPQPGQSPLPKQVSSPPQTVEVTAGTIRTADILFPPPVVFLHGAMECYRWWTEPDPGAWDAAARGEGFFSFTPNYTWWGPGFSWTAAADQVAQQVLSDFQGLHTPPSPLAQGAGALPWTLVGHDMGGLAARVLVSGEHRDDPFLSGLAAIYLVGTPNSGSDMLLGASEDSPLSANNILRRFNEVYPDFGGREGLVTAIAGTAGWWGTETADGPLSLPSALNIVRLTCPPSGNNASCTPYAHRAFRGNNSATFGYQHFELGAEASEGEVLLGLILQGPWTSRAGDPESPAGGLIWGTGARTTGTAQGSVQGRAAAQDLPFPIGPTDGMAIGAWITSGSATFQVLDPSGSPATRAGAELAADAPGFLFTRANPAPGNWTLRVLPGAGGASFTATAVENSPFGISGYVGQTAYAPGADAALRMNREGSFQGVTPGAAVARLFDAVGNPVQTVPLAPSGQHWDATFAAPQTPGTYSVTFQLDGTYAGQPFTRTAYELLTVLGSGRARIFTGFFSDTGRDRDGDGKFDAIAFQAQAALPSAGAFTLAADLYDSSGYWVARASGSHAAQGPSTVQIPIVFPLDSITCSQFQGPFQIGGLSALDAGSLVPLDLWADPVATQTYASDAFACSPGDPRPILDAVLPDEGIRSMAYDLVLSGANLPAGPQISVGPGVTVHGLTPLSGSVLSVAVSILPDAAPGTRDITLTPPSGGPVVLPAAFEVKASSSPQVAIATPAQGQEVKGEILVTASAWGDLPVSRVDFLVDGAAAATDTEFPYQFPLDTRTLAEGAHTLSTVSTDTSSNAATSAPVGVTVHNGSIPGDCDGDGSVSIGEVQKAINMFLGIIAPDCGVDCNGDGSVSIGEVQKVINNFLGIPSLC